MKAVLLAVWTLAAFGPGAQAPSGSEEGSPATSGEAAQVGSPSEQTPAETPSPVNAPPVESPGTRENQLLSSFEFWLSVLVLFFGLLAFVFEYLLLRKRDFAGEEILRIITISMIVIATLFALTAGFDNNQIAPAMGLFGTIAGYLLGKGESKQNAG